jgi:DNA-binding NtrC family response regulator
MKQRICLIEDDAIMGEALVERLEMEGYTCDWFQTGAAAIKALVSRRFTLAVSDIRLPDMSGEALFARLLGEGVKLPPFLFITAHGAIDQAVRLLKLGAADYLTKPLDIPSLLSKIRELVVQAEQAGLAAANDGNNSNSSIPGKLGISAAMRRIEAALPRLAQHADTVLLTGESGVGKEWVARALHQHFDSEQKKAFVAVNCGAIPENLLESELFGHVKGAFTGAIRDKPGVFEQADGGTLFLDEIGDMPLVMQIKLLRCIQERQVVRVGGEKRLSINIKLVCATHRDLKEMVRKGEFREDLYYRVHVMQLHIPPLRDRKEDILWLAARFASELCQAKGLPPRKLDPLAEQTLISYPWPGNIRELQHTLERACIMGPQSLITPETLFGELAPELACTPDDTTPERLADYLAKCERAYLTHMLELNNWRIIDSAGHLGITRKALWDKMRRLEIVRPGMEKVSEA